jgi:hypothetical protein
MPPAARLRGPEVRSKAIAGKIWGAGGVTVAEQRLRARREQMRSNNQRLRESVFAHYGGYRCQCPGGCRIREKGFLALDHVDGAKHPRYREAPHRGGNNLYHWLRKNGYPPGFRVLCFNCNHALGHYGRCPHQDRPAGVRRQRRLRSE